MRPERARRPASRLPGMPCACASLRRAARAVTQLYDGELRPAGIELTQFTLLAVLAIRGEMTQGGLAKFLVMDSTTLTRTLALVRRHGWVSVRAGQDRRERVAQLTAAGRRQLRQARPHWERAQHRLRAALGQENWARVHQLSIRVAEAAQQL